MNNKKEQGKKPVRIQLALPGGGAHGEYTKSILVQILSEPAVQRGDIIITGVTGTSAGAINGALLVSGLNEGGPELAIKRLTGFWEDIRRANPFHNAAGLLDYYSILPGDRFPNLPQAWNVASQMMPVDQFLPGITLNKVKSLLNKHIPNWKSLENGPTGLLVNALRARDQKEILFTGSALNADTVAASCALEMLGGHLIDGVRYFDGAYASNPHMQSLKPENFDHLLAICPVPQTDRALEKEFPFSLASIFNRRGLEIDRKLPQRLAELKNDPKTPFGVSLISLEGEPHWNYSTLLRTDRRWLDTLERYGREDWKSFCNDNNQEKLPFSRKIA